MHWWREVGGPGGRKLHHAGVRRIDSTLTLERLIATKRAAGRPKDLVALSELEALLDERSR